MAKTIKVLVACGSGVATSTVALDDIRRLAKEADIPVQLFKCSLREIPIKELDVDLILTTINYRKPLTKPHMSIISLLSGVNEDKVKKEVVALMRRLSLKDEF